MFADQLRHGRKQATIRLGDKSHKYKKGHVVVVTIGPITSATARERGLEVTAEADPHSLDGLVAAVSSQLAREGDARRSPRIDP